MYTCISFFVLFVHPLPVKHKSYREEKKWRGKNGMRVWAYNLVNLRRNVSGANYNVIIKANCIFVETEKWQCPVYNELSSVLSTD